MINRLVIAGTGVGVGKTTVTRRLAAALQTRDLAVRIVPAALCIDSDHTVVEDVSADFDGLTLIDGARGLFDGARPVGERGSTASIARTLGAPILLVVDATGLGRSFAALAHGFMTFDPVLRLAGIVCNRVADGAQLALLRSVVWAPPVLGGIPNTGSPNQLALEEWLDLDRILAL